MEYSDYEEQQTCQSSMQQLYYLNSYDSNHNNQDAIILTFPSHLNPPLSHLNNLIVSNIQLYHFLCLLAIL